MANKLQHKSAGLHTIYSFLIGALLVLTTLSCSKGSDLGTLDVSQDQFDNIDVNGEDLYVIVTSNELWTAKSDENWITTRKMTQNIGRTRVTIAVSPNFNKDSRTGTITFSTESSSKSIQITQNGGDVEMDSVVYDIPIVFHILYNERTPKEEVPSSQRLQENIEKVNAYYKGSTIVNRESPNIGVNFSLATSDPDGKTLSSPGVVTHFVSEDEIDFTEVMRDKVGGKYKSMAWDKSKYINIFIFRFKSDKNSEGVTLGVSHLPMTASGHELDGLQTYSQERDNSHNHCIVINSETFKYRTETIPTSTPRDLYPIAGTIAHELGHYLGLFHTFAESDDYSQMLDECKDTDWCEDTPSYNRVAYEKQLSRYATATEITQQQLQELLQRNACDGTRFESTNIMDYDVTYRNQFTAQQRERMRYCLYFSPQIPGMKRYDSSALRSAADLPIVDPLVSVCPPHTTHLITSH